ncbi:hypothetical protein FHG87_006665 [Trinorchestia longiramus]|nr:hypothetical protein FHG87_006665 [Trinorchestia longiramus]
MSASYSRVGDEEELSSSQLELHGSYVEDMQVLLLRLQQLWDEVGFSTAEQLKRINELKNLVRKFYTAEEAHKNILIDEVEEKSKQVFTLSKELRVHADELYTNDSLSLLEMDKHLSQRLQSLKQEVSSRRKELHRLLKEEEELCSELLEETSPPCGGQVPSISEIENIKRRINTLVQEKKHRLHTFRTLKGQISKLLGELDQPANSSFLTSIVHSDEGLFTLSLHNLDAMKRLKADLGAKVATNERELKQIQQKVEELWERLAVPQFDRDHLLLHKVSGKTAADLTLYRCELERLEEMKKANISRLVESLKSEVVEWWKRCYVSDEEQLQCKAYHAAEANDEILAALEAEVDSLREKHSAAQHIYDKLDHRDKLWTKLIELELRHNDPSRLFKNRGCALLQEERERNRVKGELPRVEAQLQECVNAWESEQEERLGRAVQFTVRGVPLHEFIHQQWGNYTDNKLMQARERQTARAAQLDEEARMGTKMTLKKRNANTTVRRPNYSSASSTSHRTALSSLSPTKKSRRGVLTENNTPTGGSRREAARRQSRRLRAMGAQNCSSNSSAVLSTYSQFEEGTSEMASSTLLRSITKRRKLSRAARYQARGLQAEDRVAQTSPQLSSDNVLFGSFPSSSSSDNPMAEATSSASCTNEFVSKFTNDFNSGLSHPSSSTLPFGTRKHERPRIVVTNCTNSARSNASLNRANSSMSFKAPTGLVKKWSSTQQLAGLSSRPGYDHYTRDTPSIKTKNKTPAADPKLRLTKTAARALDCLL